MQQRISLTIKVVAPVYTFIIAPVEKGWQLKPDIEIITLSEMEDKIKSKITGY